MRNNRHRRVRAQRQARAERAKLTTLVAAYGAAQKEVLHLVAANNAAFARAKAGAISDWPSLTAKLEDAKGNRDIAEWYARGAFGDILMSWAIRRRLDYQTAPQVQARWNEFLAQMANAAQ